MKRDDPRRVEAVARIVVKVPGYDGLAPSDLSYYAWPETYGNTAGPFGGAGGQTMTSFTLEAYEYLGVAVVFCGPKVLAVTDRFGCQIEWGRKHG